MTDWERAQDILAKAVGGKVTPGSGNGRLKGDVVKDNLIFEVKQTSKLSMSVRRFWLNKLLNESKRRKDAIFVIFFELRGYAYCHTTCSEVDVALYTWETKSINESDLPNCLYSSAKDRWVLTQWTDLKDL